ncbi:hypothetical protein BKI52_20475 [marine bacterium AO1-C]|nr:hypothetical protein BKI52_20475 [marine bacterium AO1-C]
MQQIQTMMKVLIVLLLTSLTVQAQYFISNTTGGNPEGADAKGVPLGSLSDIARDTQGNTYLAESHRIRKIDAAGKITTLAGTGESGVSGDGGPAISAKLGNIKGMALDAQGNIYLTINEYYIRKITAANGVITTIAGTGVSGFSGDGGPATAAQVNRMEGIIVDASGNIYFADNRRVRKIDGVTGIITTIAGTGNNGFSGDGGLATAAQLSQIYGITLDTQHNIYIADRSNRRIRKIDANTGIITTIAGNGNSSFAGDGGLATAAQISSPDGVVVDAAGNVYIADNGNARIRKVDATTGIMSTIMGNGGSGFTGEGGAATAAGAEPYRMALDPQGDIYFTDDHYTYVGKVEASTGFLIRVAGNGSSGYTSGYWGDGGLATSAGLASPRGITRDAVGNLYIADMSNHRVRKIDANTGIITTIAGTGTSGFSGDGGSATSAQLKNPAGLVLDATGNLFITDAGNSRIRKIDANTGIITTIAGDGTFGFAGDGGLATAAKFNGLNGIALDASDNLYLTDAFNYRIRKINLTTGVITTVAGDGVRRFGGDGGPATAASFNVPEGLVIDNSGNLYIADQYNNRVRKIDATTGNISTISSSVGRPQAITIGADGHLYVGSNTARVYRVTTSGATTSIAGTGTTTFNGNRGNASTINIGNSIYGLTTTANGTIYLADGNHNRVRQLVSSTTINIKHINTVASGTTFHVGYSTFGGTAITKDFTIENTGAHPMYVENITAGSYQIQGNPAKEIAAGGSTTFTVAMDVTSAGNKNETLTILTNASTNSTYTIALTGMTVKANQTITFDALSAKTFGDANFNLTATSDNTGTGITYTSSNPAVATISGNMVTIVSAGTTTITASQVGDVNHNAATDISQNLTINKAPQTITFSTLPAKTYGDADFTLSATGGASGNAVTYVSSNANVAKVSGNTVTIVGVGTANITARQTGNANYNAATDVSQTLAVRKANQTITFGMLPTKTYGDQAFAISATGGASGNVVTFKSSDPGVATVSGNLITIVGAGTTTITASQAGDANHHTANDVLQALTINKIGQTITFDLGVNATKVVGDAAFDLTATGGASGNAITYTSSNTAVATISGTTVTILGPGTTTITASQTGNTNYQAAQDVNQTLTVNQTTALAENLDNAQLTLFPNPTPDVVHFRVEGQLSSNKVNVTVLNRQGAVVLQSAQRLVNGEMTLPISHLASGHYLFKINIGEETILRRIIKK